MGTPIVIKADGLAAGKGVIIANTLNEATLAINDMLEGNRFGEAGSRVVIEEFLMGEEASFIVMVDGSNILPMATSQDHKARDNGDKGPNTGGMGSYSDSNHSLPFLKNNEIAEAKNINEQVVSALLEHTGHAYKGILYGGFMATRDGVKLIEYNARFGDPEAMNLLSLLDTDFASVCSDIVNGNLGSVNFRKEASVCKYIVPEGYGSNPSPDASLVVDKGHEEFSNFYYAAVNLDKGGNISTTSSRAGAMVSTSLTISSAEEKCEEGLEYVSGNNLFVRHDIAKPHLIKKRIKNMENTR